MYSHRDEARWAVTKKTELIYLIETVLEKQPLLTEHQRGRYARLKYGVLNNFNRVESLGEYENFIQQNYVETNIPDNYYT